MTPATLINIIKTNYINIDGIIIVGANICKETKQFGRAGFNPIEMFEPMPDVYQILYDRVSHWPNTIIHNSAASNYIGKSEFYVTSNSVSSSLMKPKEAIKHQKITIDNVIEVDVTTLDETVQNKKKFSTLVIDAEGSELNILKGSDELLKHIKIICIELNYDENYENCPQHDEVIKYLENKNFKKIDQKFGDRSKSYGDAVFIKNNNLTKNQSIAIDIISGLGFKNTSFCDKFMKTIIDRLEKDYPS